MCCNPKVTRRFARRNSTPSAPQKDLSRRQSSGLLRLKTPKIQKATSTLASRRSRTSCNNHSPRLICVRNLPEIVDAAHLLSYLNQTIRKNHHHDATFRRQDEEDHAGSMIRNCLVYRRVAILGCCSAQSASSILKSVENNGRLPVLGNLIYKGKRLEIGRPRSFSTEVESAMSEEARQHRNTMLLLPMATSSSSKINVSRSHRISGRNTVVGTPRLNRTKE